MAKNAHRITLYSGPNALIKLDKRTREARLMQATRDELTAHIGGSPSATERRLIDRACWLELRIVQMDAQAVERGVMSERDTRGYLAWCNSFRRVLVELGLERRTTAAPSLKDVLGAS